MSRTLSAQSRRTLPTTLTPGPWVQELVGSESQSYETNGTVHTITNGEFASLVTVRIDRARTLDASQFEQATIEAYRNIRFDLKQLRHSHPVRFWNFLPAIHEPMDANRDRYMVFNSGRFTAFSDWFGGIGHLPERLPAASGVGHDGGELVIHCLAFERPGDAIENPRQIPAFRYSARYGPRPPCFARATVAQDPRDDGLLLLVAGTASIRGEQTIHPTDLQGQLDETITNLRALLAVAEGSVPSNDLKSFSDVRVYFLREQDASAIEKMTRETFGPATRVQMCRADICRADLLVEIEGVAQLQRRSHR